MTKSFKQFSSKRHKENFYNKAKEKEVRARSYFKLEQLDEKFKFIKEGMHIIDLGCAPGGWIQYIDEHFTSCSIIGIDLLEVKQQWKFSKNVTIIQDDFHEIENYNLKPFDLVLSDMAPEFSGDSRTDRGRCHKLNIETLDFCKKYLKKGGTCVFKTFGGEDLEFVRKIAKKMFQEVKEFKPQSSQKKSAELFILCFKKL
jgi:23S rRNA (uridine2552-2'-O)-methyltransferase